MRFRSAVPFCLHCCRYCVSRSPFAACRIFCGFRDSARCVRFVSTCSEFPLDFSPFHRLLNFLPFSACVSPDACRSCCCYMQQLHRFSSGSCRRYTCLLPAVATAARVSGSPFSPALPYACLGAASACHCLRRFCCTCVCWILDCTCRFRWVSWNTAMPAAACAAVGFLLRSAGYVMLSPATGCCGIDYTAVSVSAANFLYRFLHRISFLCVSRFSAPAGWVLDGSWVMPAGLHFVTVSTAPPAARCISRFCHHCVLECGLFVLHSGVVTCIYFCRSTVSYFLSGF